MDDLNGMVRVFRALTDRTRLRIVRLMAANNAEVCVCELVDSLDEPQYHVSRHLIGMHDAGLVASERDGRWVYYRLREDAAIKEVTDLVGGMSDEAFARDQKSFEARMALREGGRCRVGIQKAHLADADGSAEANGAGGNR